VTIAFNLAAIAAIVPFVSVPGADASLRIDWIESLLSRPSMSGVVGAIGRRRARVVGAVASVWRSVLGRSEFFRALVLFVLDKY